MGNLDVRTLGRVLRTALERNTFEGQPAAIETQTGRCVVRAETSHLDELHCMVGLYQQTG
jgi:hypothetical protein